MLKKILLLQLLILATSAATFAQNDWKLKSDKDGIKIFVSPVVDSKFKALRVECNFKATLSQFTGMLMDVKNCMEWVYHTKSIRVLRQNSPTDVIYYSEISLPWPAQNRDFIAHLTATQDAATKVVTVDGPVANGMVPVKEGIVRITVSKGKWVISPINKDEVKVEYSLQVDPAGALPAWLVNLVSSEGPTQSFKSLKEVLNKPESKRATLAAIKNY